MPLDAFCLAAITEELSSSIIGSKIDKIHQPESDVIILSLRGLRENNKLLISVGGSDARIHLSSHKFDNPSSPAMFCMLLRKHLLGARVTDIIQPPSERVVELVLQTRDALSVVSEKRLIVELIVRKANIVLVSDEQIIIDCLRRTGVDSNTERSVLPGLRYRAPTKQEDKVNPLEIDQLRYEGLYNRSETVSVEKWLLNCFTGLSPLLCRELAFRAYGDIEVRLDAITDNGKSLSDEFFSMMEAIRARAFKPFLLLDDEETPHDFSFTKIRHLESAFISVQKPNFGELLDEFYTRKQKLLRLKQKSGATLKTVKTTRDRIVRKIASQKAELEESADKDYFRECGDIIAANFHLMKKGMSSLEAQDFFSQNTEMRVIKLDPLKTPQQNAEWYYKRYSKAKKAEKYLAMHIANGEKELEYLESVLTAMSYAEGERDLEGIREELVQSGYLKTTSAKQNRTKPKELPVMKFLSSSGFMILAGRNNMQNDMIRQKHAQRHDIWLHSQKIQGSHVFIICDGKEPDERTLTEAATIAGYFSSARDETKIPVDYTQVKYVKKPAGSKPGAVIYSNQKTVYITPDEKLINELKGSFAL